MFTKFYFLKKTVELKNCCPRKADVDKQRIPSWYLCHVRRVAEAAVRDSEPMKERQTDKVT